jgi:hypothetical protein
MSDVSGLDHGKDLLETRALHVLPRESRILDDGDSP